MNNSKQAVLSIVGIAILVIAVVGVSFAFFSYSRTGTTNNYITTGTITFNYAETTASKLTLTNEFPQAAGYEPTLPPEDPEDALATDRDAFEFTVSGSIPDTAQTVYYQVTAVEGTAVSEKTKFTSPSHISIKVTSDTNSGPGTAVVQGSYDHGAALPSDMSSGVVIAKGSITNSGSLQTHNYTLQMWVNSSVTISDTNTATYRASSAATANTTAPIYSNLYYSLKVNVEARDSGAY